MKKGFTLIEIIAVILILAIILVIAVPSFNSVIKEAKAKLYKTLNDTVVKTTKTYAAENVHLMPTEEGDSIEVTVDELISTGYLKQLTNPEDKEDTCNGYVIITRLADEQYAYNPHINCSTDIASSTEDGLILHYTFDDFQEPTTNLAPYTDYLNRTYNHEYTATSWGGDYAKWIYYPNGGFEDKPYMKATKTVGGTGGSYYDNHAYITIEDNKVYTISAYMKANMNVSLIAYALSLNRTADNAYRVGSDMNLTTNWQKITWTYNSGTGSGGSYVARSIVYIDNNLPLEVYWCCFQVEGKSYDTPYVNGSRTGTVKDYSGNNRNAPLIATGTPRWTEKGYTFDGIDDFISLPTEINGIVKASNFTVSAWIKNQSFGSGMALEGIISLSFGLSMSINGSGNIIIYMDNNGDPSYTYTTSDVNLFDNKYHMVTMTYDRTTLKVYVDGIVVGSTLKTFNNRWDNNPVIGYESNNYTITRYSGLIDDVRIYSRALSAEEMQMMYNTSKYYYE